MQNFRSFEGKHHIDFDESGLNLIRSFNLDTRGESGGGKSSLLHAVSYALDYAPFAATHLRCYLNDEPMFVELELRTSNGVVTIHRGDKLWLKRDWEPKAVTSSKGVAEALDELCGVNKTLRSAITYRPQRTFGMFLSKTDSEKKEFLVEVLGLHWLEEDIARAVKELTAAEKFYEERTIASVNQICRHSDALAAIPPESPLDTSDKEKEVTEVRRRLVQSTLTIDRLKKDLATEEESERLEADRIVAVEMAALPELERKVESVRAELFVEDRTELDKVLREWRRCKKIMEKYAGAEGNLREHVSEYRRLGEDVLRLSADTCPKCERTWDNAEHELGRCKERLSTLESLIDSDKKSVDEFRTLMILESQLSSKFSEIEAVRSYAENEFISIKKTRILSLEKEIVSIHLEAQRKRSAYLSSGRESAKIRTDLKYAETQRGWILEELNNRERELDRLKHENDFISRDRKRFIADALKEEVLSKEAQRASSVALMELNKVRDYLDMQRGFLTKYFAEALQQISDKANKFIGNLPNAKKVTIRFDTEYETAKKVIRNEITPVATFSGKEWPLAAGASGGMFTSVELAVDLAVAEVIGERSQVQLAWLFLDESFANGSDGVTKQGCLEILQAYAQDRLILVVEHASEFKEMFSRVIEIEYKNERSQIR